MGRTSSTRHSATSSRSSLRSRDKRGSTSRNSKQKSIHKKKNNEKNNQKKIKTLFQAIRKESMRSLSIRSDDSIAENTILEVNSENTPQVNKEPIRSPSNKRKSTIMSIHAPKRARCDKTLVIIDEDEVQRLEEPCKFVFQEVNDANKGIQIHSRSKVQLKNPMKVNEANKGINIHSRSNIQCSTPKNPSKAKSLQDLIISNFPNNNTSDENFKDEIMNLSREISREAFITIDLTKGTLDGSASATVPKKNDSVINLVEDTLEEGECTDCTIVGVQNSMSDDSVVTIVNMSQRKKEEKVHKYINRIANLDTSGAVLQTVMQRILSGCKMMRSAAQINRGHAPTDAPRAPTTPEDNYIQDMILAGTVSRNSIGSNIYNPERRKKEEPPKGLRMVVIDGSNVAMQHGRGRRFSVKGLKTCIDYFLKRGHVVKAFVPRFRCKSGASTDPRLLDELERLGLVIYTPSRDIQGRRVTSYDDRYIVQCAAEFDAVIVSCDNYRDLMSENPRWQFVIENRLLQFTWVDDMIMFPKDPLGRDGPTLEQFLKHTSASKTNVKGSAVTSNR